MELCDDSALGKALFGVSEKVTSSTITTVHMRERICGTKRQEQCDDKSKVMCILQR